MSERQERASWFRSIPGVLTGLTAIVTAVTGLVAAVAPIQEWISGRGGGTGQACAPGYVYRLAVPGDEVCVSRETHMKTQQDNQLAGTRRNPRGGPYGADTCLDGYVWRDAFDGDRICVEPATRDQAARDNQLAATRMRR